METFFKSLKKDIECELKLDDITNNSRKIRYSYGRKIFILICHKKYPKKKCLNRDIGLFLNIDRSTVLYHSKTSMESINYYPYIRKCYKKIYLKNFEPKKRILEIDKEIAALNKERQKLLLLLIN